MELYFLRHGATPGNILGQYIGITDQPLAPEGVAQARALASRYPVPEMLWVSPMKRAKQTAKLLFPGINLIEIELLHELDFGDWEEKTWEEVGDMGVYDRWLAEDRRASFPGGESMENLFLRSAAALRRIVEEADTAGIQRGAVVAHGGVFMALMHQFCTKRRENLFQWMSGNCGGFHVRVLDDSLRLELIEELKP